MIANSALIRTLKKDGLSPVIAAKHWRNMYDQGKATAPPIAIGLTGIFGYLTWINWDNSLSSSTSFLSPGVLYATSAALVGSIVPFTLIFLDPTNQRLLSFANQTPITNETCDEMTTLFRTWDRLSITRSFLPLLAFAAAFLATFS